MESPDGYILLFCSVLFFMIIGCLIVAIFPKKYIKIGIMFIILSVVILILGIGACFNNVNLGYK